jgi:hypothetical protein
MFQPWVSALADWFLYFKPIPHVQLTHRLDDGGSKDLWNTGKLLPDYTALQPRRQPSLYSPPWKFQILPSVNFRMLQFHMMNSGSSVSTVSDYTLDNQGSIPSRVCIQTSSGAHPDSCPMGTRGLFPGGKARPQHDTTTHPPLVLRSRMSRSYTSSPPKHIHGM